MIPKTTLDGMVRVVGTFPEFAGCRIVLYGNSKCASLHDGVVASTNYANVMVMIEEINVTDSVTNLDTLQWAGTPGGSPPNSPSPLVITNKSRLGAEFTGMGISCGLTIVSAGLLLAGGALTVPSGGAGIALFVAGWVGLAANAVQCGNAIARYTEASDHPDDNSLSLLDNDKSYQLVSLIVDGIGVVSAIASLPASVKNFMQLLKTQRSWAARGLTESGLKAMNRAERGQIVRELIEEASKTPDGKRALEEAIKDAKLNPKALAGGSGVSKPAAKALLRSVSADTLKRLHLAMISVGSGVAGPGVSALKSEWVGSASGSVNWVIHVLDGTD
ncbi:hypothetical protein [Terrarubrum flagellatum]|uniref:hypothetical protein n=1 Tax=Terrirubrum flagellatum TaxID=2895980 RepID=UPI00314510EE